MVPSSLQLQGFSSALLFVSLERKRVGLHNYLPTIVTYVCDVTCTCMYVCCVGGGAYVCMYVCMFVCMYVRSSMMISPVL